MSASPPDPKSNSIFQPSFLLLLVAQGAFGLAWSVFLLAPKFMSEELGASAVEIGRVAAAANVAAALAIPIVGWSLDRVGRRPAFGVGAVLCAAAAVGYAGVAGVGVMLYLVHILWGLSFVAAFNAGCAMVADRAPPQKLGQALGVFGAANIVMNAVASLGTEALVVTVGWDGVDLAAAGVALVAAACVRWMPREPSLASSVVSGTPFDPGFDGPLVRVVLASLAWGFAFGTVTVFFQPFMLDQGVADLGPFFVGFAAAAVFVRVMLGHLLDGLGFRRVAIGALLLYGVVTFAMRWLTGPTLAVFGALIGLAHGFAQPSLAALIVQGRPPQRRGTVLAYTTGGFMAGSALGVGLLGLVAEFAGFPTVFAIGGLVAILGIVGLLSPELDRR